MDFRHFDNCAYCGRYCSCLIDEVVFVMRANVLTTESPWPPLQRGKRDERTEHERGFSAEKASAECAEELDKYL
jgi:hypothetical protein